MKKSTVTRDLKSGSQVLKTFVSTLKICFLFKPTVEFLLMWFGHSNGWLSIVAHRERPDDLLVRARRERHISTFWPDVEVVHNPDADTRIGA